MSFEGPMFGKDKEPAYDALINDFARRIAALERRPTENEQLRATIARVVELCVASGHGTVSVEELRAALKGGE